MVAGCVVVEGGGLEIGLDGRLVVHLRRRAGFTGGGSAGAEALTVAAMLAAAAGFGGGDLACRR